MSAIKSSVPFDECLSFERSIQTFLKRQKKKLEKKHGPLSDRKYETSVKKAISISHHASHVLKTLFIKRISLSNAIQAFNEVCDESVNVVKRILPNDTSALKTFLQEILTHLFVQYLRIRDGFVLLTSGECRHDGDSKLAKHEKKFPSELTTLSKRNDGYTSLFSSKRGYSGYGWDEFHNEEVGIMRRLLDALRKCSIYPKEMSAEMAQKFVEGGSTSRQSIWEKLIESGAEPFESAFDRHESSMKELQRQLERNRAEFISKMERILASRGGGRLIMITEDKFERLELKFKSNGLSGFCIERQGDAFRGSDRQGSLPSNASLEDWETIMKIPSHLKNGTANVGRQGHGKLKRKRVVIEDSDSDDCSEGAKNQLKVTLKKTSPKKKGSSSSIHNIKIQLGVNVDGLERGREDVEAEEKFSKEAAYADEAEELLQSTFDNMSVMEFSDEIDCIQSKVQFYRSVCRRKNKHRDKQAWEARECLHFHLMELGNILLEYHSHAQNYNILKKAEKYFIDASDVINELDDMNNHSVEDKKKKEYSLLLCRGRAHTNLGKIFYEQSESIRKRKSGFGGDRREQLLRLTKAMMIFRNVEKDAKFVHIQATINDGLDKFAKEHVFEANSLLSMTCRFHANVLLKLSKRDACIAKMKEASGLDGNYLNVTTIDPNDKSETEEKVSLLIDQYDGACSLVDLCSSLSYTASGIAISNASNCLPEAYDQASKISKVLVKLSHYDANAKKMMQQHNIKSYTELENLKGLSMKKYQQSEVPGSDLSSLLNSERSSMNLKRNDLFSSGSALPKNDPPERFIIGHTTRKKQKESSKTSNGNSTSMANDDAFDDFGLHTNEDDIVEALTEEIMFAPEMQYRKWGDELFADLSANADSYPSCEPVRPVEMVAMTFTTSDNIC